MPEKKAENARTRTVGFAPILQHYFEKCGIERIIDDNVALDPRRKTLTHGQAAVAMITGILFQVTALYRLCKFAADGNVLRVMFPAVKPEEYFDDRLADTLDALFARGIGDLDLRITRGMMEAFAIRSDLCHNDTTSVSVYGRMDNNKTDDSIKLTFGHSKKHRKELKQLVWSMSVSSDHAFPLFQQAYSGNTADAGTYVEQWCNLIDLLGRRDFLYIGDSKLISRENMARINDNDGFFLAPAPMYRSYADAFEKAMDEHPEELLIPCKKGFNRGFEVPVTFEYGDKPYSLRMIILFDRGLRERKRRTLRNRIEKTRRAFNELNSKLNRYKLKTRRAIEKACDAILKKNNTGAFFTYRIANEPITAYRNKKRGRPAKNATPEKIAVITDNFSLITDFDDGAFEKELSRCGYYPLLTNRSAEQLSIEEAMSAHKGQYKNEHTFRRSKGPFNIEPVYIHTPERIEAFLLLFKIALQIVVLIERTARKNIDERDRGLDGFMPNRSDVRNPKSEYMLKEFEDIAEGRFKIPGGDAYGFVSELNSLQRDILSILEVPLERYDYEVIRDSS